MAIRETNTTTIEELSKSQNIRLVDIFFIGPFLIYMGNKAQGISPLQRNLVYAIGIATIIYNGKNYLENKHVLQN